MNTPILITNEEQQMILEMARTIQALNLKLMDQVESLTNQVESLTMRHREEMDSQEREKQRLNDLIDLLMG